MTDAAIPPTPPPPAPAQVSTGAQTETAPQQPAPPLIRAVPVEELPASIPVPQQQPVKTQGRVITQTAPEQMQIRTPEGDIALKTPARLPPGTPVEVELYLEKNAVLANVAVARRVDTTLKETVAPSAPATPPPLLKPGAAIDALLLPNDAAPPPKIIPEPVQAIIRLKALPDIGTLLQKLPQALPVPKETLQSLLAAPDTLEAFAQLPAPVRQKIADLLQSPPLRALLQNLPPAPPQEPVAPPAIDPPDDNLIHILRAQTGVRAAQQVIGSDDTPAPSFQRILSTLLPLVEDMAPAAFSPPAKTMNTLLPQNIFRLDIVDILPPQGKDAPAPQKPASAPPSDAMKAEVESFTAKGHPILRVTTESPEHPAGTRFVLRAPADIPLGSRVILVATPLTEKQILAGLRDAKPADSLSPFSRAAWPALEEALPLLPPEARHSLPAPEGRMTPAALLFLAALRVGDIESWLGATALQTLRDAGKRDLARRLGSDFGKIADQAKETLPSGWRMISMPFLHDESLSQLQFFIRRQNDHEKKDGDDSDGTKPATRFLVNLSLSRMGDLQLDGFLKKKQLDMVLRTDRALPPRLRHDITQRFQAGLGQTGLEGGISFQAKRQGWVTVETAAQEGIVT